MGKSSNGLYGYSERMVYRGKRFRPIFTWQASSGTRTVTGTVLEADGTPAAAATVQLLGTDKQTSTDSAGRFSIPAVPAGSLFVHAQKWTGPDNSGELREGDSCYLPDATSPDLLLNVSCADLTTPISGAPQSEVVVTLGGRDESFRKVVIKGRVRMEDCDCCGFSTCPDVGSATFFETCLVSPLERVANFGVAADQICEDEVGVSVSGTCTLLPDNRTVLVAGANKLYEAGSGSCGGGEEEASGNFSREIAANTSADIHFPMLTNSGTCQAGPLPFDCSDTAQFDVFSAENNVAE